MVVAVAVVVIVVVVVRRLSFVVVVVAAAAAAAVATCCCCSTSAQSLAGTSFSQEDGSKPRACQYVFASPAGSYAENPTALAAQAVLLAGL